MHGHDGTYFNWSPCPIYNYDTHCSDIEENLLKKFVRVKKEGWVFGLMIGIPVKLPMSYIRVSELNS